MTDPTTPDGVIGSTTFQSRVLPWLLRCFGPVIAADRVERNHRFFEEATELVQSCGMSASEAHQLVDYVYGRPVGERFQEVGGAMVTLAALCLANELNMHAAGEAELARISAPETVAKIRAKQAAKPKHSPLPVAAHDVQSPGADEAVRRLIELRHSQHARDHEIVAAIDALEKAIAAPESSASETLHAKNAERYQKLRSRMVQTEPPIAQGHVGMSSLDAVLDALPPASSASERTAAPITDSACAFYLRAALDWIDAIPKEVADALPAMPGFDRDAAESAIKGEAYGDAD